MADSRKEIPYLDYGQWRKAVDGSRHWSTATSGGSVVVNGHVRDPGRSPAVGEWGELPPCPHPSYALRAVIAWPRPSVYLVTMTACTALHREEQTHQGKGWVKKEEEMTRQSQEKPGAAEKHRSCNVWGRWEEG